MTMKMKKYQDVSVSADYDEICTYYVAEISEVNAIFKSILRKIDKGYTEEKEYKVTKITPEKVSFKCGNERTITKKPYRFINSNMVCFSVSLLNDYRTGNATKTITIEEAEAMGI